MRRPTCPLFLVSAGRDSFIRFRVGIYSYSFGGWFGMEGFIRYIVGPVVVGPVVVGPVIGSRSAWGWSGSRFSSGIPELAYI